MAAAILAIKKRNKDGGRRWYRGLRCPVSGVLGRARKREYALEDVVGQHHGVHGGDATVQTAVHQDVAGHHVHHPSVEGRRRRKLRHLDGR